MIKRNKKILLLISTIFTVVLALSFSYAFFYFSQEGNTITLTSGSIWIDFEENTNYMTLHDTYPKSDQMGKIDPFYYDFTVTGSKGEYDDILYEIQILEADGNTLDEEYVKVYLTDQDDVQFKETPELLSSLPISEYNGNRVVYSDYIYGYDQAQDYRIRVWVDDDYTENVENTFNFQIILYAFNTDFESLYEVASAALTSNLVDDGSGTKYVKGTASVNPNNYVWYSGKLWRILAFNSNGTMKLVTENNVTSLAWDSNNTNVDYSTSQIRTWLNEDFFGTLYNSYRFIALDTWDYSASVDGSLTVVDRVGLLTRTDCNTAGTTGYISNGYYWWTMTPYDGTKIYYAVSNGLVANGATANNAYGVRPSINLFSNVQSGGGTGTLTDPYLLKGDKAVGASQELLNNRLSGEYIKFNDVTYRIIGTEIVGGQKLTKIVMSDYSVNENSINTSYAFGTSNNTMTATTFNPESEIGLYLQNWYAGTEIADGYKQMIATAEEGVLWYQGEYEDNKYYDYMLSKKGIAVSATIGLLRYGEMFATHSGEGSSTSASFWLMTRGTGTSTIHYVKADGMVTCSTPISSIKYAIRPSMYLKSTVKIGDVDSDGDYGNGQQSSPYEIVMD